MQLDCYVHTRSTCIVLLMLQNLYVVRRPTQPTECHVDSYGMALLFNPTLFENEY